MTRRTASSPSYHPINRSPRQAGVRPVRRAKRFYPRREVPVPRRLTVAVLPVLMVVSLGLLLALSPAPARAQASCPNEAAREREVHGLGLPDCRSYEQVSPVDKGEIEAIGYPGVVQASRSGDRVRYFSATAFNECENSDGSLYPYYVSSRASGGGWATACVSAGRVGFSEELLETPIPGRAELAGFAADEQQLIFETEEQLLTGAVPHAPNVYEQDLQAPAGEQLTLVGLVPPAGHGSCSGLECEVSPAGAVAGAGQNGELDAGAPQGDSHITRRARSRLTVRACSSPRCRRGGSTCAKTDRAPFRSRRAWRSFAKRPPTVSSSSTPKTKTSTALTRARVAASRSRSPPRARAISAHSRSAAAI